MTAHTVFTEGLARSTTPLRVTVFAVFITLAGHATGQSQHADSVANLLSREAMTLIDGAGTVKAVSLGIVKDGRVYVQHAGKLVSGQRPDSTTLYEVASLTKTFTGTLLAKAIVDGKVSLDDDIRTFLPGDFPNLEHDAMPVTFRHLVTHTSGLPRMFPNRPERFTEPLSETLPFEINSLQKNYTKEAFFHDLRQFKLPGNPGAELTYSNAGANVLGYCLEEIYGRPYEDLLQEFIFAPLGMANATVTLSDVAMRRLAIGVNHHNEVMPHGVEKQMNAEGGIKATLDDMLKYLAFHLDDTNAVVKASHQHLLGDKYGDFENGLFWQIFKNGDQPDQIFQNGGAFGTSSWLTIIPELRTGVFIVTNVAGPEIHQRLKGSSDRILAEVK